MSTPDTKQVQRPSSDSAPKKVVEARIDAAHPINRKKPAEEPSAPGEEISVEKVSAEEVSGEAVASQLRSQAAQLASHLRARQKEVDHREAQVNARLAQLDRDTRIARLWLQEREAELDCRSREFDGQQHELQRRLDRLAAAEAAQRKRHEAEHVSAQREATATDPAGQLAREEVLRRTAETQELHRQLRQARHDLEEEGRLERQRWAAEQRRAMAELDKQRQAIQRRSDQVDQSNAALRHVRAELGRLHRETLEIRLATEELWVQLSGAAPPAAMTRSLSRIRTKLADNYRQANTELHDQKAELESIRRQLSEQYEKLVQNKDQFEEWAANHREETEEQAARLIAREQQLAQKEARLADEAHRQQTERLRQQQEIGRLRTQILKRDEAVISA